jgi:hypothetical protein
MKDIHIPIDTYHEHMCEAVSALRSGLEYLDEAEIHEEDDLEGDWLYRNSGILGRYAFLLAANSLEAAANALLIGLETSHALYADFEKLPTLLKFEVVCMAHGKKFDRSNSLYGRMKEIVQCRNEFVHPKPRMTTVEPTPDGHDSEIKVKRTGTRNYPTSFSLLEPKHALNAIGDILQFVAWVTFDLLEFQIKKGSMCLGLDSMM